MWDDIPSQILYEIRDDRRSTDDQQLLWFETRELSLSGPSLVARRKATGSVRVMKSRRLLGADTYFLSWSIPLLESCHMQLVSKLSPSDNDWYRKHLERLCEEIKDLSP